ncbi:DASS family sodium-coupled anion symporter [Vicingus serpentipes]|uniref:DASS family sodium-coupled anion symporter n=1 Tax=Vicingus serpentipes TaxID=1926625 RepID=A0A5C6RVZ8_9FLAO|nr:DASS family sodium-coupled anion symporter [Vicingus serpentipes]TXB66726.1 DASS family sodium-coupled anion symporter [Vicingus serpentipes]
MILSLHKKKGLLGILTIILAVIVYHLIPEEFGQAQIMASIVVVMAMCWVFEILPIPVTSLLPLVLFPVFEIMNAKATASFYGKDMIFLFLGGLILAKALQVSNLHQRIALHILNIIGSQPSRLVLGFMITTAFLSMWISNTSSVMVMMPIAISIIEQIKSNEQQHKMVSKLAVSMMLGIAYSADIGGMATLIGTPPNMVFMEMYHEMFPNLSVVSFSQWLMLGIPLSLMFLGTGWLLLTKVIFRIPKVNLFESKNIVKNQLKNLGKITQDELLAGIVFGTAILLWVTGSDIRFSDNFNIKGWRSLYSLEMVTDASVAIGTAVLLFIIPSKKRKNEMLLKWEHLKDLPWGILFLFGGGFALAGGFEASGLSKLIGNLFTNVDVNSPIFLVVIVCFLLTFLTEITSNTATTNLVLPILAKASIVLGIDPRILMIPATLSASCAFMMPVASPTQAIIFGSGYVKIKQMVRAGILFNLLGIIVVTLTFYLLANFVFGISI